MIDKRRHISSNWPVLSLLLVSALFQSCDKGEIPIPAREPGDVVTSQVDLSADYRYVAYFDLINNRVVKEHLRTDWDLGFASSDDEQHVVLNTAKGMMAARTNSRWLAESVNEAEVSWKYDASSGNKDSLAIGQLNGASNVFLVNRGFSLSGSQMETVIVRIEPADDGYDLYFSKMDGTDSSYVQIQKDESVNYVCVSLEGLGKIADVEPNKQDWHIKFSQYTHIFVEDGDTIPYAVTGALLNPHSMVAAERKDIPFDSVNIDLATSTMYSTNLDVIGYDWKDYDFDLGAYLVFPEKIYLLRNSEGIHWKLHFIDFYNSNGVKGVPTFEYQEL